MTVWVLAADGARARIFQNKASINQLDEVNSMVNPLARLKEGDLVTDSSTSQKDVFGLARHSGSPHKSVKQQAEESFAKYVAETLNEARQRNDFQKLYIIAAPRFLGELRTGLSKTTQKLVCGEFNHDVSKLKPEKIRQFLPKFL
jgi:protein required for attachment to host cells